MCIHNISMHNMHALIFNWIVERQTLHMHMWSIMANEKMEVCSLLTQAAELLIATRFCSCFCFYASSRLNHLNFF